MTLEEIYESAGQAAGLEVWRIEKFDMGPVDNKFHGTFYTGDCYIVLYTWFEKDEETGVEKKYQNLHFWIGSAATQDEYGSAAIISTQLDTALGDLPVQFRETEGHESLSFKKLFSVSINNDIEVKPIGLAARDTLRLEMGYCLYGNDINESVTPIEANLGWITKVDTNFIGSKSIKEQIENGIKKKLVGFVINDKGIPRKGYEIFDKSENLIGEVTSGTFSPVLKKGIGLAYIENNISSKEIYLKIRNNLIKLEVVKTPFI